MAKPTKVAIGMRLQPGPFGGGNQFGHLMADYLRNKSIQVVFTLSDPDIDVIVVTDARRWIASCAFDMHDAHRYQQHHPRTRIVLRVNECDERKGRFIHVLNRFIATSALGADHVVFISHWLQDLFIHQYPTFFPHSSVIHNGARGSIFNPAGYVPWNKQEPLRLVTHHWGANWHKGFDVYEKLAALVSGPYAGKVSFTFIGNIPQNAQLPGVTVLPPLSGTALAHELKKSHVYITASQNEPAGMHHIEGALCGLPLLYRRSGALPEYAAGFGVAFDGPHDIETALGDMLKTYRTWLSRMPLYPSTGAAMCEAYYALISAVPTAPLLHRRNLGFRLQLLRFFTRLHEQF